MGLKKEGMIAKNSLSNVKHGFNVGSQQNQKGKKVPVLLKQFGCLKCSWAGSHMCPHGIEWNGKHANGICADRVMYLKQQMETIGKYPGLIQQERIFSLKMQTDRMIAEWVAGEELDDDFKHLDKNLSGWVDKMRKQDEGIKVANEVSVTVQDFRKLVDEQAELVKGKDIVKEAELLDKQDKRGRKEKPREEV